MGEPRPEARSLEYRAITGESRKTRDQLLVAWESDLYRSKIKILIRP